MYTKYVYALYACLKVTLKPISSFVYTKPVNRHRNLISKNLKFTLARLHSSAGRYLKFLPR